MLDFSGMVLFSSALSFEMQHHVAWLEKGRACSLAGLLPTPAWVGTGAEKIPVSQGRLT